jgi:hypothetical protein
MLSGRSRNLRSAIFTELPQDESALSLARDQDFAGESAKSGWAYGWKLNSSWVVVSALAGAYFQFFSVSSTAFTSTG